MVSPSDVADTDVGGTGDTSPNPKRAKSSPGIFGLAKSFFGGGGGAVGDEYRQGDTTSGDPPKQSMKQMGKAKAPSVGPRGHLGSSVVGLARAPPPPPKAKSKVKAPSMYKAKASQPMFRAPPPPIVLRAPDPALKTHRSGDSDEYYTPARAWLGLCELLFVVSGKLNAVSDRKAWEPCVGRKNNRQ